MPGDNSNAARSPVPQTKLSGLDVAKAVQYLQTNYAGSQPGHHCAHAIREAIEAGGLLLKNHPIEAKNYGPTLAAANFVKISATDYTPQAGDIVVIQPYQGGNVAGHITMYDGSVWRSDFVQNDMWAGPGYRKNKPSHEVYRP